MGLGDYKLARFRAIGGIALCSVLLFGPALAGDLPLLTDAELRPFAVEDLDLRIPAPGSDDTILSATGAEIPGYPLSSEELNLIIEAPQLAAGFGRPGPAASLAGGPMKPPFRARLMGWIKQRSSDFNLFRLFSVDDSRPGMRLDVDTEQEELVLQYRIGF